MNVVTATSPASVPSAGVIPGLASGAAPGAGASFADVFQQLAGGDAPAAVAADGSSGPAGAGAATGRTGDADEPGDDVVGASTDATAAMGAMTVPVAFVLPPVTEVPPADGAGDGAAADEPTSMTRASRAPVAAPRAASGAAMAGAPSRNAAGAVRAAAGNASRAGEFAVTDTASTNSSGTRITSAIDGAAGSDPAASIEAADAVLVDGTPAGRLLGASAASERAHEHAGRDTRALTSAPGAARRTGSEPASDVDLAKVDRANIDHPAPAPAFVAAVTPAAVLATDAVTAEPSAETPAAATPQAASLMARLMADPARDLGRARGLAQSLARVREGMPARGLAPAPAAMTEPMTAAAATATLVTVAPVAGAAVPTDLEALVAEATALAAPAVLGATGATTTTRGQHPGLSAALRAFQQAGAPAVAGNQNQRLSEGQGPATTDAANQTASAARVTAPAGGETEAVMTAAEAGRRLSSQPALAALIAPSLGGDRRIGAGPSASARLDGAGVATLTPADGEDVAAQIVQSIRVQWTGGAGEARVRLRPEHLGEVVATIKVEQGAVTATLQAERPEVRRWLEAHTQTLREGLVEHGLKLDRLIVLAEPTRGETRDDSQGRARGRHQQPPQQRPRRPRPDDHGATFDLNPE